MERVPFDPKEMEPVGFAPTPYPGVPPTPIFNSPISTRENFQLLIKGEKPLWIPHAKEITSFSPSCVPDCWARGMVTAPKGGVNPSMFGGKDMFGVEWEFDPKVFGSMVRPGQPFVGDLDHWEDYVTFPDLDSWDWEGCAEDSKELRSSGRLIMAPLFTGLFERLISFVDMTDAMVSMIDDDSKPAVHRLFDKLCNLYDGIFERYKKYFNVDLVWFHDDWGSQRAPFFSLDTVNEMLLPYLKRCVESAHKHGIVFEFHCCGNVEMLLPAMVEAGCDIWNGQPMNDKKKMAQLYGDKIICDSRPDELPRDATPEQKRANMEKYLQDFEGLRTMVGNSFTTPPDEYPYAYELSRKAFN